MFKAILATILFLAVYGLVDWLAGVTAPVTGPATILGLLAALIYIIVKLVKAGR